MILPKSLLGRTICFLLLFSFGIQSTFADEGVTMLENMERDTQANFPTILRLSYDQLIETEMVRRLGDFHNGVIKSVSGLSFSNEQLQEISNYVYLGLNKGWNETRWASINWTRYASKKILRDSKILGNSIEILKSYWKERCDKKYFENYLSLYDPVTLFPHGNFTPDLPLKNPPLYFSVTVNQSDGKTNTSVGLTPQNHEENAILTTATVVGTTIGSSFGPLGAVVGSLIGAIVGSLVNVFRGAWVAHSSHIKQRDIKERIRNFIIGEIESLSKERHQLFNDACKSMVSEESNKEIESALTLLSEGQQELQKNAQKLHDYLEAEAAAFPEKVQTHFKDIEKGYFSELSSKMAESQNQYLEDLSEVDRLSILFQKNAILPLIKSEKNAHSPVSRLQNREELWQKKILGDVLFTRTRDNLPIDDDRIGPWKESSEYVDEVLRGAL
jgi:hypothetical protein